MDETNFYGYRTYRKNDLEFLYGNGWIRHLRIGGTTVLHAVYAAVRDRNWGTAPLKVERETIRETPGGWRIELEGTYRLNDIVFSSFTGIDVSGDRMEFTFEGTARTTFLRNRIGLCILHPVEPCRGKPVEILHTDGTTTAGVFPERISPRQPFKDIEGMSWNPSGEVTAMLRFSGDIFEMEDQRNWTDASYKTYSTPLEIPFPVKVEKGTAIRQSVSLEVKSRATAAGVGTPPARIVMVNPEITYALPGLGIARSSAGQPEPVAGCPENPALLDLLTDLKMDHCRADIRLDDPGWERDYASIAEEQQILGWPVSLALHFGAEPLARCQEFLERFRETPLRLASILLFDSDRLSSNSLLAGLSPEIRKAVPEIPLGGGTDANFTELNRNRPDPEHLDFITYTLCPQVHAADTLSVVENLSAQPDTVASAAALSQLPVHIGALTLKQRSNPVATDDNGNGPGSPEEGIAENEPGHRQDLPDPDPRQATLFGAGWTLGSLKQLIGSGVRSVTCHETTGPHGILGVSSRNPASTPLFHLLRALTAGNHTHAVHTETGTPLECDGLMLKGNESQELFLANFSGSGLTVRIVGLSGKTATISELTGSGWKKLEPTRFDPEKFEMNPSGVYRIACEV